MVKLDNYKVYLEETLSKTITIKATSLDEAEKLAREMYRTEAIILCADDIYDRQIAVENLRTGERLDWDDL